MGAGGPGPSRVRPRDGGLLPADARSARARDRGGGRSSAASGRGAWACAAPFIAAWLLSPLLARWISLPPREAEAARFSAAEARQFRAIARRTWRYFERFAGPEFRNLPADNFQEVPRPEAARRTSPTNLGLALLSTVAANDFGWIGTAEMADRLEAGLAAIGRLERFRGHLYNWYGTDDPAPLEPRYVSTVDSGNLAAHLITLKQACVERLGEPTLTTRALDGIADTLALLRSSAMTLVGGGPGRVVTSRQLEEALVEASDLLAPAPADAGRMVLAPGRAVRAGRNAGRHRARLRATRATRPRRGGPRVGAGPFGSASRAMRATSGPRKSRSSRVRRSQDRLAALARSAADLVAEMDFAFLYDRPRNLFAIGYRPQDDTLDPGDYDLLASEARLASFVAIARGDVPVEHWFHLGRPLTPVGRGSALLSWSGSMFEYLMPDLVLDAPSGSLLEQTRRLAVRRQIQYGEERSVPWGISEAAYNARDVHFTYQYSNFGVSGLGLKRGLGGGPRRGARTRRPSPPWSIPPPRQRTSAGSPSSARSAGTVSTSRSTSRRRACRKGSRFEIVKAFMAHHQGMTIVALANVILEGAMRRRFGAEPAVQATELLLQERTPRTVAVARPASAELRTDRHVLDEVPPVLRRFRSPHDPTPRTHLLSNGRYAVMMTAAGSGYSRGGAWT